MNAYIYPGLKYYSPDFIIKQVCKFYSKTPQELRKKTRKQEIVEPRQMAYYFIRQNFEISLNDIGSYFEQDHATVVYACKCIDGYLKTNPVFKRKFDELANVIGPKIKN